MHSKQIKRTGIVFVLFWILGIAVVFGEIEEYTLKAVFFERIARFLDWPDETDDSWAEGKFVIGILGKNPFGSILEEIYGGRKIKNRAIKICYFSELKEIKKCHLLYISPSMKQALYQIMEATQKRPILTIGDTEGFAEQGVCVNLYIENDKLRFEINQKRIGESGLVIDPLILKIARIVDPLGVKK